MMERLNSLEEIAIKGKLSGIRKLLFRIKKDKIRLPHIANSLLLIAAERAFNKLKKHDFDFEKDLFIKKWLKTSNGKTYFDFNGALLPDMRNGPEKLDKFLRYTFEDTFLIDCYYADDYSKHIVDILDKLMSEGPYGYKDEASGFDVTVKAGDIVIDAGAWIGDFSAYAASKGAYIYAFEPVTGIYNILTETAELNQNRIIPVKKGLGAADFDAAISLDDENSGASSLVVARTNKTEEIHITTLDKFVAENNIKKVDFIKADIEGAERDMLKGAAWTLKNFAPRLAICTYHLPDDPKVLKELILEINPNYRVIQLNKKLFACDSRRACVV